MTTNASADKKQQLRVAVVGAGIAGLTAARTLHEHGHKVRVFDKARGVGGRTACRRQEPFAFDHGAQYFTVRDARFAGSVKSWQAAGVVAPWDARIVVLGDVAGEPRTPTQRLVGVPGMNAIAKHIADGLDVTTQTRVVELTHARDAWHLAGDSGEAPGAFDAAIVALPAAQTAELLAGASELAARLRRCVLEPCWAVMLGFDRPLDVNFDGAFVHDSPLSWIARNNSKPGRSSAEAWILHAGPTWSADHIEDPPEPVIDILLAEFRRLVGADVRDPVHIDAHRWRYALPPEPLDTGVLWEAGRRLAVCGDWCHGARIEGAYLSGLAAAERVLDSAAMY
jgi:predicted NAD/FAD-dependent oxidoreductase